VFPFGFTSISSPVAKKFTSVLSRAVEGISMVAAFGDPCQFKIWLLKLSGLKFNERSSSNNGEWVWYAFTKQPPSGGLKRLFRLRLFNFCQYSRFRSSISAFT
jgi:hypothetical protein